MQTTDFRPISILLVVAYLVLTVSGIIAVKAGLRGFTLEGGILKAILAHPLVVVGGICYIASFLLWFVVLARFDLSFIFPLCAGISQILIMLGAIYLLGESPTRAQIAGALIVAGGIALMNYRFD